MNFDWMTISAIVGSIGVIIGLIFQYKFRRQKTPSVADVQSDHSLRIMKMESDISHVSERMDQLKVMIDDHDKRDQDDFTRIENKIEKLTDMMITMLQSK